VVSRARCSNVRRFAPGGIIASLVPLTIVIWILPLDACRQGHRQKYSLNALTRSAPGLEQTGKEAKLNPFTRKTIQARTRAAVRLYSGFALADEEASISVLHW
jgi:hypothetical protein